MTGAAPQRPGGPDFRRVFDAAATPSLLLAADLTIVAVNHAYAAATMLDPDKVLGQAMFEVFPDDPEDPDGDGVANLRRSLHTVRSTGATDAMAMQRYDIRNPAGGFVERYWSPVNTPVLNAHGRVEFILHQVQDVTALVHPHGNGPSRLERARLEQMQADLFTRSREVQDANAALREVNTELSGATAALRAEQQSKDQFIAVLSHELRNPLAAARAGLDLLALDVADHPAVAVLQRQCAVLTRMTDDLLDAAGAVTGRLATTRRPLDLRDIVAQTVAEFQATHPRRAGPPQVSVPDQPMIVDGDAVRLAQVLTNLLANADKHAAGATVSVQLHRAGERAELRVTDTGPGFDPTSAETLFKAFVRGGTAGGPAPAGLGVGLAIVRGIVDVHDGSISAHSNGPGTGASFTVTLPISHHPMTGAGPTTSPWSARPRLRILLIDDNPDVTATYQALLRRRGDTVTVAHTAADGLLAARDQPVDLILCDLAFGDHFDGYDLARRLRRTPAHRHTRLIAVSGFTQPADHRRSRAAGFDAHLPKPLDLDTLDTHLAAWTRDWTHPLPARPHQRGTD